jgi:hypothetical protein
MKLKFWKRSPIDMSLKNNFPSLRLHRRPKIPVGRPNEVISVIIAWIAGVWGADIGISLGIGSLGFTWGNLITVVATVGLSIWSMTSGQKGVGRGAGQMGAGKTLDQNGQLVNTRQAAKVLPIIYGIARVGGNVILKERS